MGFLGALFGEKGGFDSFNNPYIEKLANLEGAGFKGPRNYYRSILQGYNKGDYSNLPGMGEFDAANARSNREIDESTSPLAYTQLGEAGGPLMDRVKNLQKQRASEGINSQRFGFVQNSLQDAAQGLTNISNLKNQFNLQKYGTAGQLFNGTQQYRPPTQGFLGGLIGSAVGAFATGGASLATQGLGSLGRSGNTPGGPGSGGR